jgi:hypothetical protein
VYSRCDPWDYDDECYQTLCEECHGTRQELSDKAANALKLALKSVPTQRMAVVAQRIMEAAMNGGFDVAR